MEKNNKIKLLNYFPVHGTWASVWTSGRLMMDWKPGHQSTARGFTMRVYSGKSHPSVYASNIQAIGRKLHVPFPVSVTPDYSLGMWKYSVGYSGALLPTGLATDRGTFFLEVQPYMGPFGFWQLTGSLPWLSSSHHGEWRPDILYLA